MSGVQFSSAAPLSNSQTGLNIGVQVDSLFGLNTPVGLFAAEALRDLTDWAHSVEKQLTTATSNVFPEIAVLGDGGVLIGWIGARDGFVGGWFKQLYVGGTDPTNAPLFADANGNVIVGQNGSISVRDIGGNEVGWEGVRTDTILNISDASNASPSVVTINAHPYVNGDTVFIAGAAGNTAINGYRIVENVTANTFTLTDLVGAVINGNGAYGGGGTSMRYFAGAWFQSFAIGGTGFSTSKIRAFADGTVVINASLIVDSNGATTSINNSVDGTAGVVGVRVKNDTAPSQDILMSDAGFYIRAKDQFTYVVSLSAPADSGRFRLSSFGTGKSILLATNGANTPSVLAQDTGAGTNVLHTAAFVKATNTGTTSTLGDTSGASVVALRAKNNAALSQDVEVSDAGYFVRATDQATYVAALNGPADAGRLRLSKNGTGNVILLATDGTGSPYVDVTNGSASARVSAGPVKSTYASTTATLGDNTGASPIALRAKNLSGFTTDIEVSDTGYAIRATDQSTYIVTLSSASDAGYLILAGRGTGKSITLQSGGVGTISTADSFAGTSTQLRPGTIFVNGNKVIGQRITGWTAPAGTLTRTGYVTGFATTQQVAEALAALIADLFTHGVINN